MQILDVGVPEIEFGDNSLDDDFDDVDGVLGVGKLFSFLSADDTDFDLILF